MDSCTGRIQYYHVRPAVFPDEIVGKDVLHISGKELTVVYSVVRGVFPGVFDGFGHILYTYHFRGLGAHELGNCARSGVKVVHHLRTCEGGELPGGAVQFVCLRRVGLVERLGAYLEGQVLHLLIDGVVASEKDGFLVCDGVVQLGVHYVIQGCYLREPVAYSLQKGSAGCWVVCGKYHYQHHVSLLVVADYNVAHISLVLAYVVEFKAVLNGVILYEKTDFVGRGVLQPAVLYVEHAVEVSAHVKTEANSLIFRQLLNIYGVFEPTSAAEGEFQFVTVIPVLVRTYHRLDFRYFQMTYPDQLVVNLLALGLKLHFVGQMLPAAAAANSEVTAERLEPLRRRLNEFSYVAFHIVFLFLGYADIHNVTRNCVLYKYHHTVYMGKGLALGGHGFDCNGREQQIYFLSHCPYR